MPTEENTIDVYNDLDEVLNRPSRKVVVFCSLLLLAVIMSVCVISLVIRPNNIVVCTAYINPQTRDTIKSPTTACIITKINLGKDNVLKKGDTILIFKNIIYSESFYITAPYNCKYSALRLLENGGTVSGGLALGEIVAAQAKYNVTLTFPAVMATKLYLGQSVQLNPSLSGITNSMSECKIISKPVIMDREQTGTVEAILTFYNKENSAQLPQYFFGGTTSATIVVGSRSLASLYAGF
jgi:hypothetical protein